jgi:hypothetical protein
MFKRLRIALEDRWIMDIAKHQVKMCDYENAQVYIDINPPCVLHAENRMGERMLQDVLTDGFNACTTNKDKDIWQGKITELVNTLLLGSPYRRASWFMRKTETGGIGPQTMPNYYARQFMDKILLLINECYSDGTRKTEIIEMFEHYNNFIRMARKREDFTDEEIEECQEHADKFYALRIHLFGFNGITNYIHMVGAGHFKHYLIKYRNLYRFSQQGWEAYNHLIKSFFYRRTQRGGSKGQGSELKASKMEPIAKWIVRNLFWQQGLETTLSYQRQKVE